MKKLIAAIFFLSFAMIGTAQSKERGIENIKAALSYVLPKLPLNPTKDDLRAILASAPPALRKQKDAVVLEIQDLDPAEINELAKLLHVTPLAIRTGANVVLRALESPQDPGIKNVDTVKTKGYVINVRDYGAKGDGITDDYASIRRAFDSVNKWKTGKVFFPKGEYYINRYKIAQNEKVKGVLTGYNIDLAGNRYKALTPNLEFYNVDGLEVYGEQGAVIRMKGDFHRPATRKSKYISSDHTAMPAFTFRQCSNVHMHDLEIVGGTDKTTRDASVTENGSGTLVRFVETENVHMSDVTISKAQTDAIGFISSRTKPNRNFTLIRVKALGSARQGSTIGDLLNAKFIDCEFSNTGQMEGTYNSHAPGAGIDFEPNVGGDWQKGNRIDSISFEGCSFVNNKGGALRISFPGTTKNIYFKGCQMISSPGELPPGGKNFIIVNARDVVFDSCYIDAKNAIVYPAWQKGNTSAYFINSTIKGSGKTIIAQPGESSASVVFRGNVIEYTGNEDNALFPHIRMAKNSVFENNTIIFPKALKWRKLVTVEKETGTVIIRR